MSKNGLSYKRFSETSWYIEVPVKLIGFVIHRLEAAVVDPVCELNEWVAGDECFVLIFTCRIERAQVAQMFDKHPTDTTENHRGKLHQIPVKYNGPDLKMTASILQLTVSELIHQHSSVEYLVKFMGFAPGFGYLTGGQVCDVKRRQVPRKYMKAGAVAVAAGYACVYPVTSPGGWNWIGNTDVSFLNPEEDSEAMFLLQPNDRVKFIEA